MNPTIKEFNRKANAALKAFAEDRPERFRLAREAVEYSRGILNDPLP